MAFDTVAIWAAAFMGVPGILFMVKNTKTASDAAEQAKFTLDANALSLASYYLYLVGMTLFTLGMYSVALALELPAPLAACAALSGPLTVLGFMAIAQVSITGIVGISGPPIPARVALIVVGVILNGNAIAIYQDGTETAWMTFGIVYLVSMAIPHLIAGMHRSAAGRSGMLLAL
jgi:hypothetical protein